MLLNLQCKIRLVHLETKRREVANSFVKTVVKDEGDAEEV